MHSNLQGKVHKISGLRFFGLLFFLMTSCTARHPSSPLSSKEQTSLEAFFSHLLFQAGGVYTLFGDKPMSWEALEEISAKESAEFLKENPHPILKNQMNFAENWKTWQQVKERFILNPFFLLVKRASPSFSPISSSIFLVNVSATAAILHTHYEKFKAIVGHDFDPIKVVFEFENDNSIFWKEVLSSHYLVGILLGYGEINAWFFEQMEKYYKDEKTEDQDPQKKTFFTLLLKNSCSSNALTDFDISLPLPHFNCFFESQELLKKYESYQEKIKKIYKGRNLIEVTIDRLTSQDLTSSKEMQYLEKLAKALNVEFIHSTN